MLIRKRIRQKLIKIFVNLTFPVTNPTPHKEKGLEEVVRMSKICQLIRQPTQLKTQFITS